MIDHGAGLVATYGYLSKIKVKAGYAVAQGQEIGRVADPRLGEGFAGHLHFGLDRILPPWLMGASAKESRITLDPLRFMDLKGAIIPRTEANTGVVRERVSLKPARSE